LIQQRIKECHGQGFIWHHHFFHMILEQTRRTRLCITYQTTVNIKSEQADAYSYLYGLGPSTYKVVQIWPGQTVTSLHTISPGHIWTTLYIKKNPWRPKIWQQLYPLAQQCTSHFKFSLPEDNQNPFIFFKNYDNSQSPNKYP
jgi:hypothetical protein